MVFRPLWPKKEMSLLPLLLLITFVGYRILDRKLLSLRILKVLFRCILSPSITLKYALFLFLSFSMSLFSLFLQAFRIFIPLWLQKFNGDTCSRGFSVLNFIFISQFPQLCIFCCLLANISQFFFFSPLFFFVQSTFWEISPVLPLDLLLNFTN